MFDRRSPVHRAEHAGPVLARTGGLRVADLPQRGLRHPALSVQTPAHHHQQRRPLRTIKHALFI